MASKQSSPANPKINKVEVRQASSAVAKSSSLSNAVQPSTNVVKTSNNNTLAQGTPAQATTQAPVNANSPPIDSKIPANTTSSSGASGDLSIPFLSLLTPKDSPPASPGTVGKDGPVTRPADAPLTAVKAASQPPPATAQTPPPAQGSPSVSSSFSSQADPSPPLSPWTHSDGDSDGDISVGPHLFDEFMDTLDSAPSSTPASRAKDKAPSPKQNYDAYAWGRDPSNHMENNNNSRPKRKDIGVHSMAEIRAKLATFNHVIKSSAPQPDPIVPNGSAVDNNAIDRILDDSKHTKTWTATLGKVNRANTIHKISTYMLNTRGLGFIPFDVRFNVTEGKVYIECAKEEEYNKVCDHNWPFGVISHGYKYDPRTPKGYTYKIFYASETFEFPDMEVRVAAAIANKNQVIITSATVTKNPEIAGITFESVQDWSNIGSLGRIDGTVIIPATKEDPVVRTIFPVPTLSEAKNPSVVKMYAAPLPPNVNEQKLNVAVGYHLSMGGQESSKMYFVAVQRNKDTGAPLNYGFVQVDVSVADYLANNPIKLRNYTIGFSLCNATRPPTQNFQ